MKTLDNICLPEGRGKRSVLHRDQNVLCSWQGSAQTAPAARVCMSHSSLTVPWGQCAQSDKSYWNNPISAGSSGGEDRDRCCLCRRRFGAGPSRLSAMLMRNGHQRLGSAGPQPAEGCYPVQTQLTQLADPPLGQERSWQLLGVIPVLTSSFKGGKCINNKNWSHPWRKRCLENQGCQQHLRMNSQALPQPAFNVATHLLGWQARVSTASQEHSVV